MDTTPFNEEFNSTANYSIVLNTMLRPRRLSPTSIAAIVLYLIILSIIVPGNGLVLFGLARFKTLRHPSNIFVGVLSSVDLTLSVSFIMIIYQSINPALFRGLRYCQLRTVPLAANLLASELSLLGRYDISRVNEIDIWNDYICYVIDCMWAT